MNPSGWVLLLTTGVSQTRTGWEWGHLSQAEGIQTQIHQEGTVEEEEEGEMRVQRGRHPQRRGKPCHNRHRRARSRRPCAQSHRPTEPTGAAPANQGRRWWCLLFLPTPNPNQEHHKGQPSLRGEGEGKEGSSITHNRDIRAASFPDSSAGGRHNNRAISAPRPLRAPAIHQPPSARTLSPCPPRPRAGAAQCLCAPHPRIRPGLGEGPEGVCLPLWWRGEEGVGEVLTPLPRLRVHRTTHPRLSRRVRIGPTCLEARICS